MSFVFVGVAVVVGGFVELLAGGVVVVELEFVLVLKLDVAEVRVDWGVVVVMVELELILDVVEIRVVFGGVGTTNLAIKHNLHTVNLTAAPPSKALARR